MTKQVESAEPGTQYGLVPQKLAFEKPAIELFNMMLRGEIPQPPISRTLNFKLTEAHAFYEHLGYTRTSVRLAKEL